jgi:hypothetical protein
MQKNELALKLANLKEREQKTNTSETRIRTQQESIQTQLEDAKKGAMAKFGTSDLVEIREKYRKCRDADNQALQEYEEGLQLREEIIQTITESVDSLRQA